MSTVLVHIHAVKWVVSSSWWKHFPQKRSILLSESLEKWKLLQWYRQLFQQSYRCCQPSRKNFISKHVTRPSYDFSKVYWPVYNIWKSMLDHSSISVHRIHVRLHQLHKVFYQFPQYLIIFMKIMIWLQVISYRYIFQMAVWPDKHIHVCRYRKNHHSSIQFCKWLDNLLGYHAILPMVHLHPI